MARRSNVGVGVSSATTANLSGGSDAAAYRPLAPAGALPFYGIETRQRDWVDAVTYFHGKDRTWPRNGRDVLFAVVVAILAAATIMELLHLVA